MTGDRLIRATTAAVVTCVAAFAAAVSYSHIYDLGRAHGQSGTAARLLPLSVDGLILVGSLVLLHEARNRRPDAPASAPATVIAAVATNAESAARDALAASIAAGNPISQRQLASRFGISRTRAAALAREVAAEANGRSPASATP
jgi:hypothetical protein